MDCYNCGQDTEEFGGDWRHSEEDGDQYFCQECLDNGSLNDEEWN